MTTNVRHCAYCEAPFWARHRVCGAPRMVCDDCRATGNHNGEDNPLWVWEVA